MAYETLKDLLQAAAGTRSAVPGTVACLQSAGNLLDWHPHVHLLVSWGLFRRDGSFLPVEGTPDPETVAQVFRHRVLRMLLEEGAIEEGVVRNLLAWPHTGYGTHVSRAIPANATTPGIVARYMTHPPITPERMLGEASQARVIYRADAVHPRHQANFRVFEPCDFLAEVSAHIPDAHEKTILFYGWYSNRTRGYRKQHELLGEVRTVEPAPDGDARGPLELRRSWARLIRKVYEVDPLLCPRCGGTMKIIAVIERPAIVRQILPIWASPPERPASERPPTRPTAWWVTTPCEWAYEPFFDDLAIPDPLLG